MIIKYSNTVQSSHFCINNILITDESERNHFWIKKTTILIAKAEVKYTILNKYNMRVLRVASRAVTSPSPNLKSPRFQLRATTLDFKGTHSNNLHRYLETPATALSAS